MVDEVGAEVVEDAVAGDLGGLPGILRRAEGLEAVKMGVERDKGAKGVGGEEALEGEEVRIPPAV